MWKYSNIEWESTIVEIQTASLYVYIQRLKTHINHLIRMKECILDIVNSSLFLNRNIVRKHNTYCSLEYSYACPHLNIVFLYLFPSSNTHRNNRTIEHNDLMILYIQIIDFRKVDKHIIIYTNKRIR